MILCLLESACAEHLTFISFRSTDRLSDVGRLCKDSEEEGEEEDEGGKGLRVHQGCGLSSSWIPPACNQ